MAYVKIPMNDDASAYGIAYYAVYYFILSAESYYSSRLLAPLSDSHMTG